MMGAVVLPETVKLVASTVVRVKPEVEDDRVKSDLDGQPPGKAHALGRAICEEDSQNRSDGGGEEERVDSLHNADVGDLVTGVLVTVKVTVDVADAAENPQLMNRVELEAQHVVEEGENRSELFTTVGAVNPVGGHGPRGMSQDPSVERPLGQIWDWVAFLVDWDWLPQVGGVNVEDVDEVVVRTLPLAVVVSPGALHGVLGVAERVAGRSLLHHRGVEGVGLGGHDECSA
jgi:hypothetical protein